jgi:signal transduction histidine kinase
MRRLRRLRLSRVALSSARVALVTAAIVAVVYLALAAGVELLVDRALTGQIDDQLRGSLAHISTQPPPRRGDGFGAPPPDRYGPPLLVWTIHADGTWVCNDSSAKLPAEYRYVTDPQTITVGGSPFRAQGAPVRDDHVVIGMSMASVTAARSTLISAEAIVGPILLLAVFLGAFTIGRRVAAPIETARQRQMEFTADASHELRTPLSVIEATTTLALSRQRDGAWYRNAFERVHVESGRMRKLVEDLLWLARFDAARGAPDAQPIDAGVVAAQAVDRFRTVAEARHQSMELKVSDGPAVASISPEWLDRLLGVLLDNACKYTPAGGDIQVLVRVDGGRVRLTVEDSGPGIAAEERDRVFDRFHRATDSPGGAGLGLAIANAVVRASGGKWEMGTSAAGGASMSVSWPRSHADGR